MPPFDLGLWAVCTAVPFLFFGGAIALDVWHRGWTDELVGTVAGSLLIGGGMYDGLTRAGWRWSRPRPDAEAEDYGGGR